MMMLILIPLLDAAGADDRLPCALTQAARQRARRLLVSSGGAILRKKNNF